MMSLVTLSPVITAFQDGDKKSAINKKLILRIKKPHLKMIPIKDNYKNSVRTRLRKTR